MEYWDHAVLGSRAAKPLWFAWSLDVTKGLSLVHGRQKSWKNKAEDTVSYEEKVNAYFCGGVVYTKWIQIYDYLSQLGDLLC